MLPVHVLHQGQVLFRRGLGKVVDAGTAQPQQGTLALSAGRDIPGPRSSAAASGSWAGLLRQEIPVRLQPAGLRYYRAVRPTSFLAFRSCPLPKTPAAP